MQVWGALRPCSPSSDLATKRGHESARRARRPIQTHRRRLCFACPSPSPTPLQGAGSTHLGGEALRGRPRRLDDALKMHLVSVWRLKHQLHRTLAWPARWRGRAGDAGLQAATSTWLCRPSCVQTAQPALLPCSRRPAAQTIWDTLSSDVRPCCKSHGSAALACPLPTARLCWSRAAP